MSGKPRPKTDNWGVLLLAHGAPGKLEDVPEFLLKVRHGRPLPPPVVKEITDRYAQIGGSSPLLRHTRNQAAALSERLGKPVYVGMRNWHPFIAQAVDELLRDGIERLIVICLAPHSSRTSVGLYKQHLDSALAEAGASPVVQFVESWHSQPSLIRAFAEKLREALQEVRKAAGIEVPVILTAHSVPEKTIAAGDPYHLQVQETAKQVASAAGCVLWHSAYQSQGMTSDAWMGPRVESVIDQLGAAGHRHVLIAPIGFLCDHVEILYDVDVLFRNYGHARGITVHRTESLNDSPLLIEALGAIALDAIGASATNPAPKP